MGSPGRSSGLSERHLRETEGAFTERGAALPLSRALERYRQLMDRLLEQAATSEPAPACAAGCGTCCHQPIALSLVELAPLLFAREEALSSAAGKARLAAEREALQRWRAAGHEAPAELAMQQFLERRACLLLGRDDRCEVYALRPFQCRNSYSAERCSFSNLPLYGYTDLAALARRLREQIHAAHHLERFDTRGVRTLHRTFFLPTGLSWLLEHPALDELRGAFAAEDGAA
jgi:Fe-S-cluster containining protein